MHVKVKSISAFSFLAMTFIFASPSLADKWRALIVYTNAVDSAEAHQPLYERFFGIFDEINDLYEVSGMTTRAEIAGVIWDKEYVEEHPIASLYHITGQFTHPPVSPSGGMEKYVDLLEKYAADILVFRGDYGATGLATKFYWASMAAFTWSGYPFWSPPTDSSAYVSPPVVDDFYQGYEGVVLGFGAFMVGNDDAMLWAHEAGHVHSLEHSNGWRRTFDWAGNYTESNAVSGFHTVMEYSKGDGWFGGGQTDPEFYTDPVFSFSNPDSTYSHYHPNLGRDSIYPLGAYSGSGGGRISAFIHDAIAPRVSMLRSVPTNLVITEDMTLESYDYANFLASSSVIVEPGFRVESGAKMRIAVGASQSLQKRSIAARTNVSPQEVLQSTEKISNLTAQYEHASQSLRVSFDSQTDTEVSITLFDIRGVRKVALKDSHKNVAFYSKHIPLHALPNGAYLIKMNIGSKVHQRRIVKW